MIACWHEKLRGRRRRGGGKQRQQQQSRASSSMPRSHRICSRRGRRRRRRRNCLPIYLATSRFVLWLLQMQVTPARPRPTNHTNQPSLFNASKNDSRGGSSSSFSSCHVARQKKRKTRNKKRHSERLAFDVWCST